MSEPIYLTAAFNPKPDKVDEVLAAIAEVTKAVEANEPDVLYYHAFRTQDEIVFVEKYKNHAAHEAHRKTAHFQSFFQKVAPLVAKPVELKEGSFIAGFEHRASL